MHKIGTQDTPWRSCLEFGDPKGAGKSTFAMYAPQPILLLNYDGGDPVLPPGVESNIWVQNYPAVQDAVSATTHKWQRSRVLGSQIIQDILDIRNQLTKDNESIIITDWYTGDKLTIPRPKTIVLDGLVTFNSALLDWLMSNEGMKGTGDAGAGALKFWDMRLRTMNDLFRFLLPLPVNVVLITWATDEMVKKAGDLQAQPTGVKVPDIGGKMNKWAAGKVDASLYFYSQRQNNQTRYYVCTKPNNLVKCVGVRGRYDLPDAVDVTINNKNPENPWDKIWGKVVSSEKQLFKEKK